MKRILQIDGGGIMGILPAMVLSRLEEQTLSGSGKRLCEQFDLITGTSTGAIIGGCIAAGVPAQAIADFYINSAPRLLKPRSFFNPLNWLRGRYDRNRFLKEFRNVRNHEKIPVGNLTLSGLKTRFMATAYNLCSRRTHFIKSWIDKDRNHTLSDVIAWSGLSAAYFFGKIVVPNYIWNQFGPAGDITGTSNGAVFQDGGQGSYNSTLDFIMAEIIANRWYEDDRIYILSLGTGTTDRAIAYQDAARIQFLGEIFRFPFQARGESIENQVLGACFVANSNPKIIFRRLNLTVSEEEDGIDKVRFLESYIRYGKKLAGMLDESDFAVFRQ